MLRNVLFALLLTCLTAVEGMAQSDADHVWLVNELRAHPGQEAAYTQAIQRFDLPVTEEVIRRGGAVSQRLLVKQAGNMANGTHLLIIEYANWEQYINADEVSDEAAMRLFGRPYTQLAAEEFMSMRDVIRREVYVAPDPPM
jgi:hypothetical protein